MRRIRRRTGKNYGRTDMNQNNYDGGGATYSRPDTGAHESKCQKNRPDSGAIPADSAAHPVPVSGAGIFIVILYKFFP